MVYRSIMVIMALSKACFLFSLQPEDIKEQLLIIEHPNNTSLWQKIESTFNRATDQQIIKQLLAIEQEKQYTWKHFIQDWVAPTAGVVVGIALAQYGAPQEIAEFVKQYALWIALGANMGLHAIAPTAHQTNLKHRIIKGFITSNVLCAGFGIHYFFKNRELQAAAAQQQERIIILNTQEAATQHPPVQLSAQAHTLAQEEKSVTQEELINNLTTQIKLYQEKEESRQKIEQHYANQVETQRIEIAKLGHMVTELERLFNQQDHP